METWIYRCSMDLENDTVNTAAVTGTYSWGGTLTGEMSGVDTVFVDVIDPKVAIDKVANRTPIQAGDTVTYTYEVDNTGDDPLSGVDVGDDKCAPVEFVEGDDNHNYVLDPDEVWTYECSTVLSASTLNTGTVTGTDSAGGVVYATDTAFVEVSHMKFVYLPLLLKE